MATEEERRADVHGYVDELDAGGLVVVERVATALLRPAVANVDATTWLGQETIWGETFLARLQAHHALNVEPLTSTSFEAAFNASCRAADWTVDLPDSATNRFFDTTITVTGGQPKALSLKASSARDMRATYLHISKLTEAAWIQDARTQVARRNELRNLFTTYRNATEAIIMLRGFVIPGPPAQVRYQLVEIPTALFAQVDALTLAQAQQSTIPLPAGATNPTWKIRVDRSDAKITLTSILLTACTVHGTWTVDVIPEQVGEVDDDTAEDAAAEAPAEA